MIMSMPVWIAERTACGVDGSLKQITGTSRSESDNATVVAGVYTVRPDICDRKSSSISDK